MTIELSKVLDKIDLIKGDEKQDLEIDEFDAYNINNKINRRIENLKFPKLFKIKNFIKDLWPEGLRATIEFLKNDTVNLLLAGDTGIGKTFLACSAGVKKVIQGNTVYRLNEVNLRQAWLLNMKRASDEYRGMIENAKSCDILIYEELGKNKLSEDLEGVTLAPFGGVPFLIFDYRYENEKQTIITTQHTNSKDITRLIGASIYRRVLRVKGENQKCIICKKTNKG